MTLKIERISDGDRTTLRLIGRIRSEDLEELKIQIKNSGPGIVLDLDEITLVDVAVIHFLKICEAEGVELVHCSPYVREWIIREQDGER